MVFHLPKPSSFTNRTVTVLFAPPWESFVFTMGTIVEKLSFLRKYVYLDLEKEKTWWKIETVLGSWPDHSYTGFLTTEFLRAFNN